MEAANVQEKKKRKWGSMIMNFLMYGGWLAVLIFIVGIIIAISAITK